MSTGKKYYSLNGGVSLILLVFIILSLVSFATLSIVSARADERLSEKYEAQTTGYYEAYNAAQEYLASLRTAQNAEAAAGSVITKAFPINENQELVLTVEIAAGEGNEKPRCRVVSLVTNSTVVYEYDESLPVIRR